jgi:hypothetical protein
MNLFKKIFVPTGEKQELTVYEQWSVKWYSRYGEYSGSVTECCEFFTNELDARKLETALKEAFKLIRNTSGIEVRVKKER